MRAMLLERADARAAVEGRVPTPVAGPGEVLCRTLAVGLCHTDVSVIRGFESVQAGYSPTYPLTLGHEYVAEVVSLGQDVDTVEVGDRVVGSAHLPCRRCGLCTRGRSQLCREKVLVGLDVHGALAEYIVLPEWAVHPIPEGMPLELAVLAEPFAVALHAIDLAGCQEGDRLAVIGPGPVGLLTVGALAAGGMESTIIGLPTDGMQLQLGADLGASALFTVDEALETLAGTFDVVFETAGHHAAVEAALALVGPAGRVVCIGLPELPAHVDTASLAREEKSLIGSRAYDQSTWKRVPGMLAASPQLTQLVTHKLPMSDIEEAIRLIEGRAATKVMLLP